MDNIGVKFDNMVRTPKNDELGLFQGYDEILEETRNRIAQHKVEHILDIGCGTGNLCGELSEKYDVIGMDKNPEMLQRAKEKYKNMQCRIGSFLDKPFKENYADIVVTSYALHGLNEEEKKIAIKNMIKYLKNDGKIIIVDYMFYDNDEKEKYKEHFKSCNREDLWDFIDSKYYIDIQGLKEYVLELGYIIKVDHKINYTWIVEIAK